MTTAIPSDHVRRNLRRHEIIENKEEIRLIWFSDNIDDSLDSLRTQSTLLALNPSALFYTDLIQCIDLIKSIKDEQVLFILSDPFALSIIVHIQNLHMVAAIFILSPNNQNLTKLKNQDDRIIDIFADENRLLESIRTQIRYIEKQTVAFNLFDDKQESIRDVSTESASFLWYQLLTHILKKMPRDEQAKQEMLDKIRDYYQTDHHMLEKIEKFRLTYRPEKAIEWYTDESFLYKQLNKALRTKDIQLLYSFRFFVVDLCAAIQQMTVRMNDGDTLILYRGQQLSAREFEKITKNVGKVVSSNGFFSTSRDRDVALIFSGQSSHLSSTVRSVLFEIEVNSSLAAAGFADVADISRFKDEQEVLLSLNALFKIVSVQFDSILKVWKVCMITTNDGPDNTGEYRLSADEQLIEYSPIIYFGYLTGFRLGQLEVARQYFHILLKLLPADNPDFASVYSNIGHIDCEVGDLNSALNNYEFAYKMRQEQLPPDNPHISSSLVNIGGIYRRKGDFDRALEYFETAAIINNRNYSGAHVRKAAVDLNIALVMMSKKDFDTALNYLFRALDMYKCVLPAQHYYIGDCFGLIGCVYEKKGNWNLAFDYYHQQMKIDEVCYPFEHAKLCRHMNWFINVCIKTGNINVALTFCQKRLNAQKSALNDEHPGIARTLIMMANVIQHIDREKAFEHYQEALSILQLTTILDYQAIAKCREEIGYFCSTYGMLHEALNAHQEAVNLYRQILSSNHIDLAGSLRNLGIIYRDMHNISEAKRCFNESLSIYQANYYPEHTCIKTGLADLANLNEESA